MSLSDYAKKAALNSIEAIWSIAAPNADLSDASPIRHLILTPLSMFFAAVTQETTALESAYIGRPEQVSEDTFALLMSNIPGAGARPAGARSTTVVRVYLRRATTLALKAYPYFRTAAGRQFAPITAQTFRAADVRRSPTTSELYVDVTVVALDYGVDVEAGSINQFTNLTGDVIRVENIQAAVGSRARSTNGEWFDLVTRNRSDGSRTQVGGLLSFVTTRFPDALDVQVVDAASALMERDEVFTVDGIVPNLDRQGYPLAARVNLGTLNFDQAFGRAVASSDVFTQSMVGQRIAVVGDAEVYRLITSVLSARQAILSGGEMFGSAQAYLWGRAPRTLGKVDVYAYMPLLHVRSVTIDRRRRLVTAAASIGASKVYYTVAPGFTYDTIPSVGALIISEGTPDSRRLEVTSKGSDGGGSFVMLATPLTAAIGAGARASLYPSSPIIIGEGGDITTLPVLYVSDVEELDPNTLEPVRSLPLSGPGSYSPPGYYVSSPDAALIFSTREDKQLVLDAKRELVAFKPIVETGAAITDTSQVSGGSDVITRFGVDFQATEGRAVTISVPEREITQATISAATVVGVTQKVITFSDAFAQYFTEDGGRVTGVSADFASGTLAFSPFTLTNVRVAGNTLTRLDAGIFVGTPADYDPVQIALTGGLTKPAYELEAVVARGALESFELFVEGGLPAIYDGDIVNTTGVEIEFADEQGGFDAAPVRVVYFTHPSLGQMQDEFDSAQGRNVCGDTLARSYLPALIDISIEYRGLATPAELQRRFIELLQQSVRETPDTEAVQIDVSDILQALNTEGLASSYQVDFEVKVTQYLADGEHLIRYLRPSAATKQTFAISQAVSASDDRVVVRKPAGSTTPPPARGKIVLGGLNPATQESLPYEGVIDNEDDTYTLILRSSKTCAFAHPQWEPALVGVREWDPALEYQGSTITIPPSCRPYLRQGLFIKRA